MPDELEEPFMLRVLLTTTALAIAICGCERQKDPGQVSEERSRKMTISVSSSAFPEGGMIPARYTGDGADVSPPLTWTGIPEGIQSIALICEDPDAPGCTWVHWVMWNIPPGLNGLPENVPPDPELPDGSRQGVTDFRQPGYGGPCPPSGTHRYYFRVYALDAMLDLPGNAGKAGLLKAMRGRLLAEGQLMGKYSRR